MKNQMMTVKINQDLNITIGHKTKLGKLSPIITYGNHLREQRGLRQITANSLLRKQDFWEFVIARNTQNIVEGLTDNNDLSQNGKLPFYISTNDNKDLSQNGEFPFCISSNDNNDLSQNGKLPLCIHSDYSVLDDYKDDFGRIDYKELMKQFPDLIRSQRGGKVDNRGHWMDLHILLKVAAMLDKDLEVQIYDIFIKGNILQHRDDGGEQFKLLNVQIDTLADRTIELKPKGNKGVYIQISKLVRLKLEILNTFGYNEDDHTAAVQTNRGEIIKFATNAIKMGMITTYPQLRAFILNYPITKSTNK